MAAKQRLFVSFVLRSTRYNIVTDLINAWLGDGAVNTF
jgi:hypothetical protein